MNTDSITVHFVKIGKPSITDCWLLQQEHISIPIHGLVETFLDCKLRQIPQPLMQKYHWNNLLSLSDHSLPRNRHQAHLHLQNACHEVICDIQYF